MMMTDDTIVALATPLGEGGIGVVRVSGPDAKSISSKIFSNHAFVKAASHTIQHGWITHNGTRIDEALLAYFKSPSSYTGEDTVEISCHGSPAVLKKVLDVIQEQGARMARPGEFTQRAYLNGKLDLSQAEAVANLISARSEKARAVAANQLEGQLSDYIGAIRKALLNLLAHIEANLDFVEEDIPGVARTEIQNQLDGVQNQIDGLLSTSLKGRYLREGLRLTLVGKPNVGKSSLFNALLASNRAIVTSVPGTTRDTLEEQLEWDGVPIVMTDTAGLRKAKSPIEKEGTKRTKKAQTTADVILLVLDSSRPLSKEDIEIAKKVKTKKVVLVMNKSDKKLRCNPEKLKNLFSSATVVGTSATKKSGLSTLRRSVLSSVSSNQKEVDGTPVLSNKRHVHHLEKAQKSIRKAKLAIAKKASEEAFAKDVRQALEEIGQITGQSVTEDVLSRIFKQFCIGK